MKPLANIDLLKESLTNTKKAILLLGSAPNFDTVASALGFSLALQAKGIDVQVASLADMRVEFSRLVGVDQVRNKIGNRNLVVSFDYTEDQVEKVSYNISEDGKRFNLIISPKSGTKPLEPETVRFEYAGADAELIGLFGINNFEELGSFYDGERLLFDTAMTVDFTLFPVQPFIKCHMDASEMSSLSELMAHVCDKLELQLNEDSASNLLAGIDVATGEFRSPLTTADTFETVAMLLRLGAVRQPPVQQPQMSPQQMPFTPQYSYQQPPTQASNNQFAQLLGNTRPQQAQVQQPIPSEMKG